LGTLFELSDFMRSTPLMAICASLWLASFATAQAQVVVTGQEVRVNPLTARSASVVLYPDTGYSRVVPRLLYPGERNGPIVLRPPGTRRAATRSKPRPPPAEAAAPKPQPPKPQSPERVASAPPPKPQPPKPPPPKPQPAPPPQRQPQQANPYLSTPDYSNVFGQAQPKPAPAPQKPPAQVATAAPPAKPAPSSDSGLVKRSVILFAKDAPDPAEGALSAIKFLATDLNAAMTRPSSRIELQAYGGPKGDKGSDARRLSLKRALAIRQVLIDDGVSADRIDVRAMGGADDTGPLDRVDVFVRA
jgi:outer membrane protein OmpA-like peptidoglycan-associated protein